MPRLLVWVTWPKFGFPLLLGRARRHRPTCAKSARVCSESFGFFGGMARPSSWRIAWIKRLSPLLPGTTAGPESPPSRIASRASRRSPPRSFSAPDEWQRKHSAFSTGAIFSRKRLAPSGSARSAARAVTIPSTGPIRRARVDPIAGANCRWEVGFGMIPQPLRAHSHGGFSSRNYCIKALAVGVG